MLVKVKWIRSNCWNSGIKTMSIYTNWTVSTNIFTDICCTFTGLIKCFRLLEYPPGLIVQTPEKDNPGHIEEYLEQPKLAQIFQEAKQWAGMLDTRMLLL